MTNADRKMLTEYLGDAGMIRNGVVVTVVGSLLQTNRH